MSFGGAIGRLLNAVESRWSLVLLLQGTGLFASFALPAWAVSAMQIFSDYAPLSWVLAGFLGLGFGVLVNLTWQWAFKLRIRAKYDARLLEGPSPINPLDRTFENRRIFLNEFVLPSHNLVEDKTFIGCEIIGPANMYWFVGNQAGENRLPQIDAVYLDPAIKFNNGVVFKNCIFRGCSFQRITLFVGHADYEGLKKHALLNWISLTPDSSRQGEMALINPPSSTSDNQLPSGTEQETQR